MLHMYIMLHHAKSHFEHYVHMYIMLHHVLTHYVTLYNIVQMYIMLHNVSGYVRMCQNVS